MSTAQDKKEEKKESKEEKKGAPQLKSQTYGVSQYEFSKNSSYDHPRPALIGSRKALYEGMPIAHVIRYVVLCNKRNQERLGTNTGAEKMASEMSSHFSGFFSRSSAVFPGGKAAAQEQSEQKNEKSAPASDHVHLKLD